jgi:hypothetical protein
MSIMSFTVEETNLIAIYRTDTAAATLARIAAVLPYMDADMQTIAENASRKLTALTGPEYSALSFIPADETDG